MKVLIGRKEFSSGEISLHRARKINFAPIAAAIDRPRGTAGSRNRRE
jgi:hypothetical protein